MSTWWFVGNALSVAATACITVSNKDVLVRLGSTRISGPGMLLVMHRLAAFAFWRLTYLCTKQPPTPNIRVLFLIGASTMSSLSIVSSFLVLREASVAFHQLSRLAILPMSAVVDLVLYGRQRTALEYSSILFISYGAAIGLQGDVTATPRAAVFATVCTLSTLASSTCT